MQDPAPLPKKTFSMGRTSEGIKRLEEDGLRVNVAVCGRFHCHQYVKFLDQQGILEKVYFSYKRNFDFGVEGCRQRNKWLKEYLMRFHLRFLGEAAIEFMLPVYHKVWEMAVLRDWVKADVAHFVLHGAALRVLQRCKETGAMVIGEVVNAHPDLADRILADECRRLGLQFNAFSRVKARLKREAALCNWLLAPSHWVAKSYVRQGATEAKIYVLPYPTGAGPVHREDRSGRYHSIRILSVGSVSVRKGQYYLVEAVKRLNFASATTKYELTLVGSPEPRYFNILLNMRQIFQHRMHVPNERMIEFMREFDVFVLPSLEDGFGIVVGEALQAGLPVVTTTNSGAAEAITNGVNGYTVGARDSVALSDAIAAAANLKVEPGFVSHGQVRTWAEYAERLVDIYRSIMR